MMLMVLRSIPLVVPALEISDMNASGVSHYLIAVISFITLSSMLSASKVMSIKPDSRSTTAKNCNTLSVLLVLTILSEQVNALIPTSFRRLFLLQMAKAKIKVPKIRAKMPLTRGIVV